MAIIRHVWRIMNFSSDVPDEIVLREIGVRMEAQRLARNLTQAQLAREAGVSRRTIERMESGAVGTQLSMFVRVCRALDIVPRLELLLPPPAPSPIDMLRNKQKLRKRARTVKEKTRSEWIWGDEE